MIGLRMAFSDRARAMEGVPGEWHVFAVGAADS